MKKILIIGASGQIGSELTMELRRINGNDNVIATDLINGPEDVMSSGKFETLDVLDKEKLSQVISKYEITEVYHLAALLSGSSEKKPKRAWDVNMNGLFNVLDLAKEFNLTKVFWPSSIAVFGNTTPKVDTPQITIMEPNTVYGISKLAGERWCEYYFAKSGVDVRSLRYPGLISYKTEPGGGTTDYAVEIFYEAVKNKRYTCFLEKDTRLPMMFMSDAISGTIKLMDAPVEKISTHGGYNMTAISFTPKDLADEIRKHIPEFEITYEPDFRQKIANTWPESIDDSLARSDWGWEHTIGLAEMTEIMLNEITKKLSA